MKGGNLAAIVKRTSSPLKITFIRSERYLDIIAERTICILPILFDQCGSLDDGALYRQMGPIDKRCGIDVTKLLK
jgi:hypothetical protein